MCRILLMILLCLKSSHTLMHHCQTISPIFLLHCPASSRPIRKSQRPSAILFAMLLMGHIGEHTELPYHKPPRRYLKLPKPLCRMFSMMLKWMQADEFLAPSTRFFARYHR